MFALAAPAVLANPLVVRAASTVRSRTSVAPASAAALCISSCICVRLAFSVVQVAKKAFDVVARNSLRGITDILSERFKGNAEVRLARVLLELPTRGTTDTYTL